MSLTREGKEAPICMIAQVSAASQGHRVISRAEASPRVALVPPRKPAPVRTDLSGIPLGLGKEMGTFLARQKLQSHRYL